MSTNFAQAASQVVGAANPFGVALGLDVAGVSLLVHRHVWPWRARPVASGGRGPDVPALQFVRTRNAWVDHERSSDRVPAFRATTPVTA